MVLWYLILSLLTTGSYLSSTPSYIKAVRNPKVALGGFIFFLNQIWLQYFLFTQKMRRIRNKGLHSCSVVWVSVGIWPSIILAVVTIGKDSIRTLNYVWYKSWLCLIYWTQYYYTLPQWSNITKKTLFYNISDWKMQCVCFDTGLIFSLFLERCYELVRVHFLYLLLKKKKSPRSDVQSSGLTIRQWLKL